VQLKLDALQRIQIAYGMAQLAEEMHLVPVTEINLRAKRLHIIPAVVGIMWYRLTGMYLGSSRGICFN